MEEEAFFIVGCLISGLNKINLCARVVVVGAFAKSAKVKFKYRWMQQWVVVL